MCYADLVSSTSLAPFEGGQDDGYLRMNFRAFSFAAENSDTVDIVSFSNDVTLKRQNNDFLLTCMLALYCSNLCFGRKRKEA